MRDINLHPESAPSGALFVVLVLAALAGAAGVGLAATAAHRVESTALATAATMLMIHAGVVVALVAIGLRMAAPGAWAVVAGLMLASVSLFSGDIALNTLAGRHLFPMAAPIGGSLLIASWIVVAGVAAWSFLRGR
jgi:uncharacterized membrane protein YgdD (TMEM256/DUF423 family)